MNEVPGVMARIVHGVMDCNLAIPDDGEPFEIGAILPRIDTAAAQEVGSYEDAAGLAASPPVTLYELPNGALHDLRQQSSSAYPSQSEKAAGLWRTIGAAAGFTCANEPIWLGFSCQEGHRLATTVDGRSRRRVGLHIDSWDGLPLAERSAARLRLCANLGTAPRILYVVATTVDQLLNDKTIQFTATARVDPRRLVTELAHLRPSTSVWLIPVPAGHAYLAPTENLIHDGASPGPENDVTATWLGHFECATPDEGEGRPSPGCDGRI
jgi:hypothetical protein